MQSTRRNFMRSSATAAIVYKLVGNFRSGRKVRWDFATNRVTEM